MLCSLAELYIGIIFCANIWGSWSHASFGQLKAMVNHTQFNMLLSYVGTVIPLFFVL